MHPRLTVDSGELPDQDTVSQQDTLQIVLCTAVDAVIAMDARGAIVDWNAKAEIVFGWRRDEVVGRSLLEALIPPRLHSAYAKDLARLPDSGSQALLGRLIEFRARRRDGSELPVELAISTLGKAGPPLFIGFARDITDRQDTLAKLVASEARFRAAIDAVKGVLWTNNGAGEMVGDQPAWAILTGQTYAEYQGYGWTSVVHADDVQPTVNAWNIAVAERRPFEFEHRVRRFDGVWRDFAIRAIPSLAPDGSVREWVGVHTDITERKRAEIRLRESEARFRAIADTAPSPVWMTTAAGDIEFANQAFATFAGLRREAPLGNIWLDRIHPDDLDTVVAKRAAARSGPKAYGFEARFLRHDGVYRWMLATATPRHDTDGAFQGYVGMAMDITGGKQAEARQHLLINELNHRVKNTLASIQFIARQTLRPDETPPHVRERFLSRLLAMSAAQDVLTRESWEGADIREVIGQAIQPFADEQDPGQISWTGPSQWLAPGAALALALALHELATNAVKYGALSSMTGRVVVQWEEARDGMVVVGWKEHGGPAVEPPRRKGFGSRLLEGGLTNDLGGRPSWWFATDGVEATLPLRIAR